MAQAPTLTASYSAPSSDSRVFSQSLPTCPQDPSTAERTASLTALRNAIVQTQDEINVFLTRKMGEDKNKAGAAAVDDAKFEESYGEEAAEGD